MVLSVNAQNGWNNTVFDADELKGTESYTSYYYEDVNGMVVFFSNESYYKLVTNSGIFDYGKYDDVIVTVGFYDINNKLIKKEQSAFYVSSKNSGSCFLSPSLKERGVFFKKYIEEEKGYVRIIAPRYGRSDFDIKIPCMNN
jgi:hypothetical protein